MKDKTQRSPISAIAFEGGQLWQLAHSHVQVELVGRTLVHYRHYTGLVKRPPILLSSKLALQKFLRRHRAVIVGASAVRPPTIHDHVRTGRKLPLTAEAGGKRGTEKASASSASRRH